MVAFVQRQAQALREGGEHLLGGTGAALLLDPAVVVDRHAAEGLGETLAQNRLSALLVGDQTLHTGMARSLAYRWFTDHAERQRFPADDHAQHGRTVTAQLLATHTRNPDDPRVTGLVETLLKKSEEFADIWRRHPVLGPYCAPKLIEHPQVGLMELHGQSLIDPDQSQILTVFTATPGSESYERLNSSP